MCKTKRQTWRLVTHRGYGIVRRNIVFYVTPSCVKHMHNAGLIFKGEGSKKNFELEITRETGKCERQGRNKG